MKEYTITMSFSVEATKSGLDKINRFAEDLSQKILDDDSLMYEDDIEVVEISVDEVIDHNEYDFDDDESDYGFDDDDENY